ncbi:hypothetical protein BGZ63DRAFT_379326 [Mariannaea sp. PMI_226]|nr:hypothetical protein BGZ63DRAFT_379326 [Mariannaea sp. PMI_226]
MCYLIHQHQYIDEFTLHQNPPSSVSICLDAEEFSHNTSIKSHVPVGASSWTQLIHGLAGRQHELLLPLRDHAKKKRVVFIWTCCLCPCSGMRVSTPRCPGCGIERCENCRIEKTIVRE